MNLKSKKYPNIKYEKGQEIFLSPEEMNSHFYFRKNSQELFEKNIG